MIMLATDRNVEQVLMELKEYAYAEVLYLLLYLLALLAALHVRAAQGVALLRGV
jgi:hypothetical protein